MLEYIRTANLEFNTGDTCRLQVDIHAGAVVVEGRDTNKTTLQVVAHLWEDSAADADDTMERILRGIRSENSGVRVEIPHLSRAGPWFLFGRGSRVDIHVVAPRRTKARIASRSGRVEVVRVEGPVEIDQRSGRTTLTDIGADSAVFSRSGAVEIERVRGDLKVGSRTGKVTVREVEGDVTIESRTGAVQVERVRGDLSIGSHTGRLTAERIGGDLEIENKTGAVHVEDIGGKAEIQGHSGRVHYRGAVKADIDIRVTVGAIHLDVDPDSPFFIDAETTTGAITSELQPRRDGAPPADAPRVRLRTTTGAIRIGRLSRL